MPQPRRLVLLGHPVAHSLSPRFQQAALDHLGIPLRYEAIDVAPDTLRATLERLGEEGAAGNITVPHKQAAMACCAVLTPVAQRVGAVNTFWTDALGRLHGDNTDVGGFEAALRTLLARDLSGLRVLVLGAGGAALAVREAVRSWEGASLRVHARRPEEARAFAAPLGTRAQAVTDVELLSRDVLDAVDLVVNATPLGLRPDDAFPLPTEALHPHTAVLDLVYGRVAATRWVMACRGRGLAADDGLRMLVEQGALAFERWFGVPAPRQVMLDAIRR